MVLKKGKSGFYVDKTSDADNADFTDFSPKKGFMTLLSLLFKIQMSSGKF